MALLTARDRVQLLANGDRPRYQYQTHPDVADDFRPVVKPFTPDAGCTWLLTELDPEDPDLAFGLCDLGLGFPELGYGGRLRVIALIEEPAVIGRVLRHLGLPTDLPAARPARAPPLLAAGESMRHTGRCSRSVRQPPHAVRTLPRRPRSRAAAASPCSGGRR